MKTMSVSYAPNKLRVPVGFQALLEGLAREVLREQPHDCVEFCAHYFRNLVEQRHSKYSKRGLFPPVKYSRSCAWIVWFSIAMAWFATLCFLQIVFVV